MTAMIHRLRRAKPAPPFVPHVASIRRRRVARPVWPDGGAQFALLPGWRWSCTCTSWGEDANWRRQDALADFTAHVRARTRA